ncbi:MAG: hypothetical protein C4318_09080 [Acidimicrobiia bacterium]
MEESEQGLEEKRPNWFVRAKIPLWLALPIMVVAVLFAFFIGYPQRSVSSAVAKLFGGTDNVQITYCLSNEAAKDPERWKAEERFKEELKNLGVRNVEIRFVSPCPSTSSSGSGMAGTTTGAGTPIHNSPSG